MRTVPLGGKHADGRVALVDDSDYELVSQYHWHAFEQTRASRGYTAYARTQHTFMHTMLTGWARVDHQDGNGLNNQRQNLREATRAQNGANSRLPVNNTSGFKGVYWNQQQSAWEAYIWVGRQKKLGCFGTPQDAARAYDAAALAAWGEYARLNFPQPT